MLCTKMFFFCFDIKNNICTQNVVCNSINNFMSYCGLTEARMRVSEKDLLAYILTFIDVK